MRIFLVLLALAALGTCSGGRQAADQQLLNKQQDVMQLLQKITMDIPNQQLQKLGASYDIESNSHLYNNPIIVKYYAAAVKAGLVQPKGTVFSNTVSQLRKEASLLYRILTGAQDYQTFFNTAAWARVHVNEGQFIKALIAAILTRQDTQGIILPPSYEIMPQLYLDSRIIQEAQQASIQGIQHGIQNVPIPVNYSALLAHDEQQLSYFTQDVGLANYYAYLNLVKDIESEQQQQQQQQPLTQQLYQQQIVGQYLQQKGQKQQDINGHGAKYLYLHQQLLAHYELNRLSNGLGPIQKVDYTRVNAPFQPHLRNLNGLELPGRPENLQLQPQKNELIHHVQKLEQRLMEAIDSGHVITPQGIFLSLYQPQGVSILGDLIEGCGKSINPRYYGSLEAVARKLLGNAPESQNIWDYTPSALELGQTALRDPAFYQLYKRIISLHQKYQKSLPAYQSNDLILPGVTIQNVDVNKLVTLFTDFFIDLDAVTASLGHSQQQQQVQQQQLQQQQIQQQQQQQQQQQVQQQIKAHLKRLDHKPFQYQIYVHSEKSVPNAVVRVFLGPKHDYQGRPISISHNKELFVELDQFLYNLPQGQTVIIRNSQQAPAQSHDWPSAQQIQQGVNGAIRSQEPFYIIKPQQIFSFPARLALPKGQPQGYPLQLLVVISGSGRLNVPFGPVIPEENLAFQSHDFQIIKPEQYEQLEQQQRQQQQGQSPVPGIQQNVEVLPENWVPARQQIPAVRNQYANVYTKYHGQYPHSQIHNPVGQGQGMTNTIQGVGVQSQRQQPRQVIQGQSIQQFRQQRQLGLASLVTRGTRVTRQVFQQNPQGLHSFGLGTSHSSQPSQGENGQGSGLGSCTCSQPSQGGSGQGSGLASCTCSQPSKGDSGQGSGLGSCTCSWLSQGESEQGSGLGSCTCSQPSQGGSGQGSGLGSCTCSWPSQGESGQGSGLGSCTCSQPSQGGSGQGSGLGSCTCSQPSQDASGQDSGLGSCTCSWLSQGESEQGSGLGSCTCSQPSQGGSGQGSGLGSCTCSQPSQDASGQDSGLGSCTCSWLSQGESEQGSGLGSCTCSQPSQGGSGQGSGLGSCTCSQPSQDASGQDSGLGSCTCSWLSQGESEQGSGLGSCTCSQPSQGGSGQGSGLGSCTCSQPSQDASGQDSGLGSCTCSWPSQGESGQRSGLGSCTCSQPSQDASGQDSGLGSCTCSWPSQGESGQRSGLGSCTCSQPSQDASGQDTGLGSCTCSWPSQGESGQRSGLGSCTCSQPSQDASGQDSGLGSCTCSWPSQGGSGQGSGLGSCTCSQPSQGGSGQGSGLGSCTCSQPSQDASGQDSGLGSCTCSWPSQGGSGQGSGLGSCTCSQPSQDASGQDSGLGSCTCSWPSQGESGQRSGLGSCTCSQPSQGGSGQGSGLGSCTCSWPSQGGSGQGSGLGSCHCTQSSQVPNFTLDQSVLIDQVASGQLHNGGFQGIYAQPQMIQDPSASEYYQNQQASQSIGGAISLDGKPLGFPLDRPLTPGALSVPNIFVKDVLIFHQGQPTNDIIE